MIATLTILAMLWLFLNIFDIFLTWLGIQSGAIEVFPLYYICSDFATFSLVKMGVAVLVAIYCLWKRKTRLLIAANAVVFGVCLWNCFTLRQLC